MPAITLGNATKPSRFGHFWQGAQTLAPAMRNDIWTSKNGPYMVCFVHFDLEMCFAPQPRALFRHLNCEKRSAPLVFCTFWLGNVLRATTACTFSTSQLQKVIRTPSVLCILTWKCASRHNGVQFFISRLASWLRTRRFSEPTFRPCGAPNHWKNRVFRDFPTFSRICIFFLLTLSLLLFFLLIFLFSLPLPCSAFLLSILSEVWLLNFLRLTLTRDLFLTPGLLITGAIPFYSRSRLSLLIGWTYSLINQGFSIMLYGIYLFWWNSSTVFSWNFEIHPGLALPRWALGEVKWLETSL